MWFQLLVKALQQDGHRVVINDTRLARKIRAFRWDLLGIQTF